MGLVLAAAGCGGSDGEAQTAGGDGALPSEVNMLVPFPEDGGTDTWARFFAQWLADYVAGNPSFSVENVPGEEAMLGTNQFVANGATDGSEFLVSSSTSYFQDLLGRPGAEYDFTEMRPLIINSSGGVVYGNAELGVETLDDLVSGDPADGGAVGDPGGIPEGGADEEPELKYGGISASGLDLIILLAFEVLRMDVEAVFDEELIEGRSDARQLLEQGELTIDFQTTAAYFDLVEPLTETGYVEPLFSIGQLDENGEVVQDPVVPDLPHVGEVYEDLYGEEPSGPAWEAYTAYLGASATYQKGLWAAEGTPDAVVADFTEVVEVLNNNDVFLSSGREDLGGYPVFAGAEIEEEVLASFEISEEAETFVLDLLEEKYDTTIG